MDLDLSCVNDLTDEQLEGLARAIKDEVARRIDILAKAQQHLSGAAVSHVIEVVCDADDKPYVCRWVLAGRRAERQFFDLGKNRVDGNLVISTTLELQDGWVIEQRLGGRKEDYVVIGGKVRPLGSPDRNLIMAIKQYLDGRLTAGQLAEVGERDDGARVEVCDDLRD